MNQITKKKPFPPLRRPKCITDPNEKAKKCVSEKQYVIVTLKNNNKLVVSSDGYHGLIIAGSVYKCVFCNREMDLDHAYKEYHKKTAGHLKAMTSNPNMEDYGENLIRNLRGNGYYCTICNIILPNPVVDQHLKSDTHTSELGRAVASVNAYKVV
uniref:C2H2-type domain-containing protein n=1 Tax=Bombyx mori TaxID=7091 RepID=A0A8R2AGB5_BOMMO|nr:uncharacterized protein LOC101744204 [Bombyx mori]